MVIWAQESFSKCNIFHISKSLIYRHPPSTLQNYAAVIRVVHGTEEVHTLIRKAMLRILPKIGNSFNNPEVHENDNIKENETEEHLETSVNGVWCLSVGFRLFESNFEAIKVKLAKI